MKLNVTMERLVPRKVRVRLQVVGEAVDADGGRVYFVTRAEALRVLRVQTGDPEGGRNESRWRNYELESRLRSAAGFVAEDGADNIVINEWCPFNGVWTTWAEYASIDEMEKTIQECRHDGVTSYLRSKIEERGRAQGSAA